MNHMKVPNKRHKVGHRRANGRTHSWSNDSAERVLHRGHTRCKSSPIQIAALFLHPKADHVKRARAHTAMTTAWNRVRGVLPLQAVIHSLDKIIDGLGLRPRSSKQRRH
jgi:hypothetical protein